MAGYESYLAWRLEVLIERSGCVSERERFLRGHPRISVQQEARRSFLDVRCQDQADDVVATADNGEARHGRLTSVASEETTRYEYWMEMEDELACHCAVRERFVNDYVAGKKF